MRASPPLPPGAADTGAALALFDALPAVPLAAMVGAWRGSAFPTGHPLDGLLESCGWEGKRVDAPDAVQPLVFRRPGGGTVCVRPLGARAGVALVQRWPALKSAGVGRVVQAVLPLLATHAPQARLRELAWRGRTGAAIVYDTQPIIDVLRAVDSDTVLGLMDMRGVARPLFFVLRRAERPVAPAKAGAR